MAPYRGPNEAGLHSIGDVQKATGISVFTLRMWERRYGAPVSLKLESGHRRYAWNEIIRLRLVKLAIEAGVKPSEIVNLPISQVEARLAILLPGHDAGLCITDQMMALINNWDEPGLLKVFREEWQALGPIGFVTDRAAQLLHRIGESWCYGELPIAAEHFASEILESFLASKWRSANETAQGQAYVVASLDGEVHGFGLHMCAAVLTTVGHRVVFLGTSTPVLEIAKVARDTKSSGVCISVSELFDKNEAEEQLKILRSQIPQEVAIFVGGMGAPISIEGVKPFSNFKSFYEWIRIGSNVN